MPEQIKTENYQNLGGINRKASQYITGNQFALDIVNMDFTNPGSWNKRWGTTFYIGQGLLPITGLYEFINLSGASRQVFGTTTNLYGALGNGTQFTIQQGLASSQNYSFSSFADRMFYANGTNFMKWNGGTTKINSSFGTIYSSWLYSLPKPGSTLTMSYTSTVSGGDATLILTYSYGYVNDRGFHGPVSVPFTAVIAGQSSYVSMFADYLTDPRFAGSTFTGFAIPASYGIGFTQLISYVGTTSTTITAPFMVAIYRDNGPGTPRFRIGYAVRDNSVGGTCVLTPFSDHYTVTSANGGFGPPQLQTVINGSTFLILPQTNFPEPTCISPTLIPTMLETYNNQLFMAGFTQAQSVVQFAEIGEPEEVQPTSNFEVRTNDGDYLTGMKAYLSQLSLFKLKSFHSLSGDNPSNFSLREISDQYGNMNPRTIVTYEDKLLFLDKKGIAQYNGAAQNIISNPVEDIFLSMNIAAAVSCAMMMHVRPLNQVWCAIPTNGATLNNVVVVYDYLLNAWTTHKGYVPNSFAMMFAGNAQQTPFYGDFSGTIYNFGSSLMADMSATTVIGMTCLVKTRFNSDEGESTQKLFRRLWTNIVPFAGASSQINVEFFTDYNSASSVTLLSFGATLFQNRLDFGISAKSIAMQYSQYSSTDPFTLDGFALGHRFLRNV